ncbi:hypothetical protein [Blastochloris viridis]|uniref:GGDEF domain-containing protein n=1 Tax=Blastochloris viridis TaxID=1079 RepID=A0A0H5BJY6_BLAVI|nr:hypothetical protein [Blastochloris viridis]ALK09281.1 hypothetical protein BVIR_1499 [Blastochloris viridis]BAS00847.1 hypothetical protein BV133_3253 [Blastochloris viridis]CUU41944.1 hypothetical protein BVIRIDIS_09440 [Blastochloris viridis]
MQLDGPVVLVTREISAPIVGHMVAMIESEVVPVGHAEAPAVVRSIAPAAVLVVDSGEDEDAADALTAAILTADHFVPLIRRWSPNDSDRIATLWLDAEADAGALYAALQQASRTRTLLLETLRRRVVATAAALGAPALPDPWAPARDTAVLVIDNGAVLPVVAPICAARGISLVGAPSTSLAGTYLELRHFDAVVIGPAIDTVSAETFLSWLRDDPRRRDLPAFWLGADPAFRLRIDLPSEILAPHDPRLGGALYAAARLHALEHQLSGLIQDMHAAGLADPDTGLLWPDAFRAGVIQSMAWAESNGRDVVALRLAAEQGQPLPAVVPRMVARLMRRSDLVTQYDDSVVLVVLVGSDRDTAARISARLSGILTHTALVATGRAGPALSVRCVTAKPGESAEAFLARLGGASAAPAKLAEAG